MKIQPLQLNIQKSPNLSYQKQRNDSSSTVKYSADTYSYNISGMSFTGINKLTPKKMDIANEIKKLLKNINEILEFDTSNFTEEEILLSTIRKKLNLFRTMTIRKNHLLNKIIELENDTTMSNKEKIILLEQYKRENKAIDRMSLEQPKNSQTKKIINGDKIDFKLLNTLKSEILNGKFNLLKIYKGYYENLTEIRDLKTLQKRYPKIKLPQRPEDVIAKKLLDTLTKDFYEQQKINFDKRDTDAFYELSDSVIENLCRGISKKYHANFISTYDKLSEKLHSAILQNFVEIKNKDKFSQIPQQRKLKEPKITQTDVDMLSLDFDDFVLEVLNRQYLNSEKLNDIVYEHNGKRIPIKTLSNTEYKFEKASERIRQIISTGEKIKNAQRDYDSFGPEELQNRLEYFSNRQSGSIDEVFERIMDFNSCRFEPEDIYNLRKFLKRLDEFEDGDISANKLKDLIMEENLKPIGTENLDSLERKKLSEEIKIKQRKAFELTSKQKDFDHSISILYENNMDSIAATCLKYRPQSLEPQDIENAHYIVNIIKNAIKTKPINKEKIKAEISRFEIYNIYKNNKSNNEIFDNAVKLATQNDGSIDINKAGQHIKNLELIENYPKSKDFTEHPEVLEKIMDRVSTKEKALKYLFKFDEYTTLSCEDKSRIGILNNLFDCNNPIQKQLLKYIVEKDYAKTKTSVLTRLSEKGEDTVESVFHPNSKQQIIAKYKFPVCMEYLQAFEDALNSVSFSRESAGVKITGSNNRALEYKMEVKIKNHDDRLFSSKNNYVFDIFSSRGLH